MTVYWTRSVLLFLVLATVSACSTGPTPQEQTQNYPDPVFSAKRILPEDYDLLAVYDPWQGFNRRVYNFNYQFDQLVFLPVVESYEAVVPGFMRTGVHNFYKTMGDVNTIINSVLQLKPGTFLQSTGRVLVNGTVGLLGLVDVASRMGIPRPQEDFGQTLGRWGVGRGPYLMVPFLGPSNLRDGIGLIPDLYVESLAQSQVMPDYLRPVAFPLDAVDTRADTSFRYYESGFIFEYRLLRWLYSNKRDLDVLK